MVITLTPDLEQALIEQARQLGTTPEALALQRLRENLVPATPPEAPTKAEGTLADFLAGHIGVLHSRTRVPGGGNMSVDGGQKFAEGLKQKRAQGRL